MRTQHFENDFDALWHKPEELRKHVPDHMLRITRGTSIAFGAGICVLLFIIAYRVAGVAAGLIAVLLLLGNLSFERTAQRGLTDTILLFYLTLIAPVTLLAAAVLRRHWQGRLVGSAFRRWSILFLVTVLVPGLTVALAAGSKLNGALAGPAYVAGLILGARFCNGAQSLWRRWGLVVVVGFLAAAVAVLVFVVFNPYYHHNPIARMAQTLRIWDDFTTKQQIIPGYGLFTIDEKTTTAGYHALRDSMLPLPRLLATINLGTQGAWLTVLGFAAGLTYLIGRCLPQSTSPGDGRPPIKKEDSIRMDAMVVLCWVLVIAVGVTLWLPLAWDRHMLPAYLAIALTTAIGLGTLPWSIDSAAALFAGSGRDKRTWRIAAGVLCTVAIWVILAFTPWVISPMLLRDPALWDDPDSMAARRNSPLILHHRGLFSLEIGMNEEAAGQFEAALVLLDPARGDVPGAAVRRCCILYDLARARVGEGNLTGGIQALREHIAELERFRDTTKSGDPGIRDAYNQNIVLLRAELARLVEQQTTSG